MLVPSLLLLLSARYRAVRVCGTERMTRHCEIKPTSTRSRHNLYQECAVVSLISACRPNTSRTSRRRLLSTSLLSLLAYSFAGLVITTRSTGPLKAYRARYCLEPYAAGSYEWEMRSRSDQA